MKKARSKKRFPEKHQNNLVTTKPALKGRHIITQGEALGKREGRNEEFKKDMLKKK